MQKIASKLENIYQDFEDGYLIIDIVARQKVCKDTIKKYLYLKYGKEFVKETIQQRRNKHFSENRKQEKSWCWKGGKEITRHGYVRLNLGSGKRQLEHRYIMEQKLGRKLKKEEHVHHKNGIRHDNRIENLEIIDQGLHIIMHNKDFIYERRDNGTFKKVYKQSSDLCCTAV